MPESPLVTSDEADIFGGYRIDGLYVFGPRGMTCVLAFLIEQAKGDLDLVRCGTSPDAVRLAKVRIDGQDMQRRYTREELEEREAERRRPRFYARAVSGHASYAKPLKPATSGRRRKAA